MLFLLTMTENVSHEYGNGGLTTPAEEVQEVAGWGVFRPKPWDFIGLFPAREQAERALERDGFDYGIAYGTGRIGSQRFDVSEAQPSG